MSTPRALIVCRSLGSVMSTLSTPFFSSRGTILFSRMNLDETTSRTVGTLGSSSSWRKPISVLTGYPSVRRKKAAGYGVLDEIDCFPDAQFRHDIRPVAVHCMGTDKKLLPDSLARFSR